MDNPKHLQLLINVAGVLIGLFVIGYVAYAALRTTVEAPCSARYPAATRFSLQTGEGKPLSAIELQARAGVRDIGVIDNASVVHVDGAPWPEALEVKLRKLPGGADASASARNGIEFRWRPPGMASATAACLSYGLWLPDKFPFGPGGSLPGVLGATPAQQTPGQQQPGPASGGLSVLLQWNELGKPMLAGMLEGGSVRRIWGKSASLPTDRWVRIEQEVVLNEPGQENGRIRLWIDGSLALEDLHVPLRKDANAVLSGVLVSVGYQRAPSLPAGVLRLSPFDMAWR